MDLPSYLMVTRLGLLLTEHSQTQRLQPNRIVCVSNSYRGIKCTPETAEPLGVSPPEAVDLFQIKNKA